MLLFNTEQAERKGLKERKAKRQYSGGFRNYQRRKTHVQAPSLILGQGDIIQITLPEKNPPKITQQEVQRLVKRLTTVPVKEIQVQNEDSNQQYSQSKFYQNFKPQKDYADKVTKTIIINEKDKINQQIAKIFKKYSSTYQNSQSAILHFIFDSHKNLTINNCPLQNYQILNYFKGFLRSSQVSKSVSQLKLPYCVLSAIARKNIYFYCFLRFSQIKGEQGDNHFLQFDYLMKEYVTKGLLQPTDDIVELFTSKKSFTVPYKNIHQHQLQVPKMPLQQNNKQTKYQYKANSIPKSLYIKPQLKKTIQFSQTKCQPFSFVDKKVHKVTPEQYYIWERNFKAKQVPRTTYQSTNQLLKKNYNENQIKQKAKQLLKEAQYPSTMQNLKDYQAYLTQRNQKIQKKWKKSESVHHQVKPIPNFQRCHAFNMIQLQDKKAQNRKPTQFVPFNFHEIKRDNFVNKSNFILRINQQEEPQIRVKKEEKNKERKIAVKSTMKFEAYVNFRKKQQHEKEKEKQQKSKEQKRLQINYKKHKQILLERMKQQFEQKARKQQENIIAKPVLIDLKIDEIYKFKPLLMQGNKLKQEIPHTSLYHPII